MKKTKNSNAELQRKLKELNAQSPYSIIEAHNDYTRYLSKLDLFGSGCIINISLLGGQKTFEAFISGEAFNNIMRDAMQRAILETLRNNSEYLNMQLSTITSILSKNK